MLKTTISLEMSTSKKLKIDNNKIVKINGKEFAKKSRKLKS